MVAKKKKSIVKVTVEDQVDGDFVWEGTSCIIAVIVREDQTKDATQLQVGLMGKASDEDLLVMLRYLLDKMQESIDDKDIAAIDLLDHMAMMRDHMLANSKQKQLMEEHGTIQ